MKPTTIEHREGLQHQNFEKPTRRDLKLRWEEMKVVITME